MKKAMYVLKENNRIVAYSQQPHFGWKPTTIDDDRPTPKTGEEKLTDKYRQLYQAASDSEKAQVKQDFIKARTEYRKACQQRLAEYKSRIKIPQRLTIAKTTAKEKPKRMYWELDNMYYDKVKGTYVPYLKKIIEPTGDITTPWRWTGQTYADIAKLEYYGTLKVTCKDRVRTISEMVELHRDYHGKAIAAQNAGNTAMFDKYKAACARAKSKIDDALDRGSRLLKQELSFSPERRITFIDQPLPDDDTIIACYPVEDKAYNGEVTAVDCGVERRFIGIDYNTGEEMYGWSDDDCIIKSNGDITFGNLIYDARYSQLPSIIAKAKTFGYTPRTEEGFFRREEGIQLIHIGDGQYKEIPKGIRGMCITVRAAAELNVLVNYLEGSAELGNDISDPVEIHHEDGIQVKTITQYEYKKHQEEYLDWKEVECRDFQVELDYDDNEEEEEVM